MSVKQAGEVSLHLEGDLAWVCSFLGGIPVDPNDAPIGEWPALSELDWKVLVNQLQTEGLALLIYWTLSKSGKSHPYLKPLTRHCGPAIPQHGHTTRSIDSGKLF